MMILNFKTTIRSISKHKLNATINVFGLAVGFSAFILISLFVKYEKSWDKHNVNYERIYRVQRTFVKAVAAMDGNNISPHTHGITAKLIEAECPEVEKTMVVEQLGGRYLSSTPLNQIYEQEGIITEPSIFDIFTYQFIEGNSSIALKEPFSVILSKSMADKLFPEGNAVGKTILIEKRNELKVTGIYKDLPKNSIFRPTYIVSLTSLEKERNIREQWTGDNMTFVMLKSASDLDKVNAKVWDLYKVNPRKVEEKISLRPLSMLYLNFNYENDYLIVLFLYRLIGVFILLLACFNYINLATAQAAIRTKEIAVKKVCGSSKVSLITQLQVEAVIVSVLAVTISFFIIENFLPIYNSIVRKDISFSIISDWAFSLKIISISILTGLLSGAYPALFLASRNIIYLLKGNLFKTKREKLGPKKILIVLQFSISLFLIIITIGFSEQIKYLLTKDLGFNKDNIVYARFSCAKPNVQFDDLKSRIISHPEFKDGCFCEHIPFVSFGGGNVNWEGCLQGESVNVRFNAVNYDFLNTLGIQVLLGRGFSRKFSADTLNSCIINETACRSFGWKDPIGKKLANNRLVVVGVVKNYMYKDMHNGIEPAVLVLESEPRYGDWSFAFRVEKGKIEEAKRIVQVEFENYFPNSALEFKELNETFKNENVLLVYNSVNNSLVFFTVINIFLAIIGLLGLVSFTIQRRTKEIGIRKINGSSDFSIFMMLTKEYLSLIVYSSIIAWPASYIMYNSIPGANKLPLHFSVFIISTMIIVLIVVVTSTFQTVKVSISNPVDALRYE
ncbi:MAG: ABC transporter permease [Bacteroidales bacterium]|nr:MAG: ABC transporter permease [Bacteroidales bacterium]